MLSLPKPDFSSFDEKCSLYSPLSPSIIRNYSPEFKQRHRPPPMAPSKRRYTPYKTNITLSQEQGEHDCFLSPTSKKQMNDNIVKEESQEVHRNINVERVDNLGNTYSIVKTLSSKTQQEVNEMSVFLVSNNNDSKFIMKESQPTPTPLNIIKLFIDESNAQHYTLGNKHMFAASKHQDTMNLLQELKSDSQSIHNYRIFRWMHEFYIQQVMNSSGQSPSLIRSFITVHDDNNLYFTTQHRQQQDRFYITFTMIMDYCDYPSIKDITNDVKLNLPDLIKMAKEVCNGIENLHSRGIIHADLNMEHILYDFKTNKVVFIDYGNSRMAPSDEFSHALLFLSNVDDDNGSYLDFETLDDLKCPTFQTDWAALFQVFHILFSLFHVEGVLDFLRNSLKTHIYDHSKFLDHLQTI
jgi:hypothetical protein